MRTKPTLLADQTQLLVSRKSVHKPKKRGQHPDDAELLLAAALYCQAGRRLAAASWWTEQRSLLAGPPPSQTPRLYQRAEDREARRIDLDGYLEVNTGADHQAWREVVQFWFPEGPSLSIDANTHKQYWLWRMQGSADEEIRARFTELTAEGAAGRLDHWACHPEGRLALIIVLDQFPRSFWRGTGRAFAQDPAALTLVLEGLSNGHYAALGPPWFKIVHGLPLGHCEGEDHLDRLELLIRLRTEIAAEAPAQLQPIYRSLVKQARDVKQVIANFGRHPHRNKILGRQSTAAEEAYLAEGRFPHRRAFQG